MFLLSNANSLWMIGIILVMLVCLVIFLPFIDTKICKKVGVSLTHGISDNPNATHFLRIRKIVLYCVLGMYLAVNLYLVVFSRSASQDYYINTAFMYDLTNSIKFDMGLFGVIKELFVQGFQEGFSHIHIEKPEDITQVISNTMFYIPMGYLLPYVIEALRHRKRLTILLCFMISFVTENLQLILKRGIYDLDDLFFNTLGGVIGYLLFVAFAYCVTHPDWRKEQKRIRRWKKNAKKKTLFKYNNSISSGRSTILATSEDAVHDFYVDKLGFRLKGMRIIDDKKTYIQLKLGSATVEVRCMNESCELPTQILNMKSKKLEKIRKRLVDNGVSVSDYKEDVFSHRRVIDVDAPDNVTIIISE